MARRQEKVYRRCWHLICDTCILTFILHPFILSSIFIFFFFFISFLLLINWNHILFIAKLSYLLIFSFNVTHAKWFAWKMMMTCSNTWFNIYLIEPGTWGCVYVFYKKNVLQTLGFILFFLKKKLNRFSSVFLPIFKKKSFE